MEVRSVSVRFLDGTRVVVAAEEGVSAEALLERAAAQQGRSAAGLRLIGRGQQLQGRGAAPVCSGDVLYAVPQLNNNSNNTSNSNNAELAAALRLNASASLADCLSAAAGLLRTQQLSEGACRRLLAQQLTGWHRMRTHLTLPSAALHSALQRTPATLLLAALAAPLSDSERRLAQNIARTTLLDCGCQLPLLQDFISGGPCPDALLAALAHKHWGTRTPAIPWRNVFPCSDQQLREAQALIAPTAAADDAPSPPSPASPVSPPSPASPSSPASPLSSPELTRAPDAASAAVAVSAGNDDDDSDEEPASSLPDEWFRFIKADEEAQLTMPDQPPLSAVYLSGVPASRQHLYKAE